MRPFHVSTALRLGALALSLGPLAARAAGTTGTATVTLAMLRDEALAHNRQIAVERAKIEEARALYELAVAQAYPRASATALFGGPTPEAKTAVLNELATTTPPSLEGDLDFGRLGVTLRLNAELFQPIYAFGRIDAAKRAASHLIDAAERNVEVSAAEVVLNVHRAYWGYVLLKSFETSLGEGEETLAKVQKKVEQLIDAESPQVTESDRLRILHGVSLLQVRKADATASAGLTLAALKLLVGRPQAAPLVVERAPLDGDLPTLAPLGVVLDAATSRRPELQALRALVAAQEAWLDSQTRAFFPTFFVGGVLQYALTTNATDQTNPFLNDRFNFFDVALGLGVRVELDLFTKLANRSAAAAQLGTRLEQAALAAQAVELEITKIHGDLAGARERLVHLERAYRAARSWQTSAVLAYDIGTGDADELIDAFLARATAEAELRKTQFDYRLGVIDLERAAGRLLGGEP